jgi:predicted nucleic acid-binding protein
MPKVSKKQNYIFDFKSPPPDTAYLDPSFLLNILLKESRYHLECRNFAKKLKSKETLLLLSNLGLDEIWYILLRYEAVKEHGLKNWLSLLKENPQKVIEYSEKIERATTLILEIPNLILVEISAEQSLNAIELIKRYGLLPRDAIHAQSALASGVKTIITTDIDFLRVEGLKVYTCHPKV